MNSTIKNNLILLLLCISFSVLVFLPSLHLPFFSDDYPILLYLVKGKSRMTSFLRIIGDFSLYIDYSLFEFDAFGYHLHSIILHGFAGFLCMLLCKDLATFFGVELKKYLLILGAILFILYPFAMEPVLWIVGRGVIIAGILSCLSIISLLRYLSTSHKVYLALAWMFFVVAMLAYESAFAILPLSLLLTLYKKRTGRKTILIVGGFALLLALNILIRIFGFDIDTLSGYYRAGNSITIYAKNIFALAARSIVPPNNGTLIFLGSVAGVFVLTVVLFFYIYNNSRETRKQFIILLVLIAVSLMPYVTVGINTHTYEGGRFLYFPAFFVVSFLILVVSWIKNSFLRKFTALLLLTFMSIFFIKVQSNWLSAGDTVKGILQTPLQFRKQNIFYNIPDNVDGSFIFRNGFKEALIMNRLIPDSTVKVDIHKTMPEGLQSANDSVAVFLFLDGKLSQLPSEMLR